MSERKKRNIIIGSLCAVVLLMTVGYAAFQTVLNINGTSNIISKWDIKIINITTKNIVGSATNKEEPTFDGLSANFKTNLVSPGDALEYEVTVSNEGNFNAILNKIMLSDTNNPAIKFTTSGLSEGSVLNSGSTSLLNVKVEFLTTATSTPSNKESTLTLKLDYSQAPTTGGGGVSSIEMNGVDVAVVTENDGLYADIYESGRYVYKGKNPNNYITYNGEQWRIIASENDGTLKIRKINHIEEYDTFDKSDSNSWTRPATLNTYLNNNYYNTLSGVSRSQIQSHSFGVGAITYDNTDLAAQIARENGTTWTGNIGLIGLSDYLRANNNAEQCGNFTLNNTNVETCKTTNYLLSTGIEMWTITPAEDYDSNVFVSDPRGYVYDYSAVFGLTVMPTLYLKSDITISGEGTSAKPYTIN